MALTFTIGSQNYARMSSAVGRKAKSIRVDAAQHKIHRFHPPGANGNLLIFDGRIGGRITATVRYVETLGNALSAFRADRAAFVGAPVDIVDDDGQTYARCTLVEFSRISDPQAMGSASKVFFDAVATFTWDG